MTIPENLYAYYCLMRFDRPIGIYLLLWPTLWGLWLAGDGQPPLKYILIFTLGTILMRAAGCVLNDIADAHYDANVWRTKDRPLATQLVKKKEAYILAGILIALAFALVLMTNVLTMMYACAAVLIAAVYPFLKRFTHLPQLWLGLAFAWGIPMSYAALQNAVPWTAWLLFVATIIWVVAYDTMYAMADRPDDVKVGVKSIAIFFGRRDRVIIAILQAITFVLLSLIGFLNELGWIYYVLVLLGTFTFLYQHKLIQKRVPEKCLNAFLNNHWFGLFVFLGIMLSYFD